MMEVIGRFAPDQHIYSTNESFLSFERTSMSIPCLESHGRKAVWKECRLPVCVIDNEQGRPSGLAQLQAGDVWGIGRQLTKRLQFMGISTALQLANYPIGLVRKEFNVEGERIVRELNGQRCKKWDGVRFYKIGVGLLDLTDGKHEQADLFNPLTQQPKADAGQ